MRHFLEIRNQIRDKYKLKYIYNIILYFIYLFKIKTTLKTHKLLTFEYLEIFRLLMYNENCNYNDDNTTAILNELNTGTIRISINDSNHNYFLYIIIYRDSIEVQMKNKDSNYVHNYNINKEYRPRSLLLGEANLILSSLSDKLFKRYYLK